jgi:hypothetical protein
MAPLPSVGPSASALDSLLPRPRREASEQDLASTAAVLAASAAVEAEEAALVQTAAVFSPPSGVRCVDIVPAQQERRGKARD